MQYPAPASCSPRAMSSGENAEVGGGLMGAIAARWANSAKPATPTTMTTTTMRALRLNIGLLALLEAIAYRLQLKPGEQSKHPAPAGLTPAHAQARAARSPALCSRGRAPR